MSKESCHAPLTQNISRYKQHSVPARVGKRRITKPSSRPNFGTRIVKQVYYNARNFRQDKHTERREFLGACLDIGAQRSCIGLPQAEALCRRSRTRLRLKPSYYT